MENEKHESVNQDRVPFAIHFEERVENNDVACASTNTVSTSDDDTGTYRRDTEDHDT